MCFYPVCIILRPAAALSAAARAHLGPGSTSSCSAQASGLADPTAAFVAETRQKRSLLITPGRHSGAAELFLPRMPPPPSVWASPACSPQGTAEGRESEPGGWSPRDPGGGARLTFARSVPRRTGRGFSGPGAGPRFAPGPAVAPRLRTQLCTSHPAFFAHLFFSHSFFVFGF